MIPCLLSFLLPEPELFVFVSQEFLRFPPLLIQQGLEVVLLLPGLLQPSSEGPHLHLELTLLLLTAPLEDQATGGEDGEEEGGTVS